MANDLLASLNSVGRTHSHVVFNEKTQEFERAGKRHAIASFFGTPDAKAKNNLMLQKIKEALSSEVAEGGNFSGYGNVTDGLFAGVDGDRRIKSATINSIIRKFREEASSAPDRLRELKSASAKAILDDRASFSFASIDFLVGEADKSGQKSMAEMLGDYESGRAVLEMMTWQLLDSKLADKPVSSAIDELKQLLDCSGNAGSAGTAKTDLINFFKAIHDDPQAKKSFLDVFSLVNEMKSDRFNQMVGCELARIVAAHGKDPKFNVQDALGRLCSRLGEQGPAQKALLSMEAIPIRIDSYELAMDFSAWEGPGKVDCLNLLAHQPVDSRMPLIAAMKAFGNSRDIFLLHKLIGVQDSIKILHDYGNLTPENIYRAIEGEMVQLPECVANERMTIRGDDELANYFSKNAGAELDDAIAKTGWSNEKKAAALKDGLNLMQSYGISAHDAVESIRDIDTRYPVFTGARHRAVIELRAGLGDCFERMSSGTKYNLLSVPNEYRRPLVEALKITTGGNSYDDRLLHLMVFHKDEINNLWNEGRLTKANVLQLIATGLADIPESAAQINPYYQAICPKFGCSVDEAAGRLEENLMNEREYMITIESPYIDQVKLYSTVGPDSPERAEDARRHGKDVGDILTILCGKENQEQVALAMSGMAMLAKQALLPYAILNGAENRSISFNPCYEISVDGTGDLNLKISNLPGSEITLDWSITIHQDGTHTASTPVVGTRDTAGVY